MSLETFGSQAAHSRSNRLIFCILLVACLLLSGCEMAVGNDGQETNRSLAESGSSQSGGNASPSEGVEESDSRPQIIRQVLDDDAYEALKVLFLPFEDTGYTSEDVVESPVYAYLNAGNGVVLGEECELAAVYDRYDFDAIKPGDTPFMLEASFSSGGKDVEELKELQTAAEGLLGTTATVSAPNGHFVVPVPGSRFCVEVNAFGAMIENLEHSYYEDQVAEEAERERRHERENPTGLIAVLDEVYEVEGLRAYRRYRKYDYYLGGDLVGTKTIWGDGQEDDNIFSPYKDEYHSLPDPDACS